MTDPAMTGPAMTGPAMTGPAMTGPAMTDPAMTDPAMTDPAMTDPAMTDPAMQHRSGGTVNRTNLVSLFWPQLKGFSNESIPQTAPKSAAFPGDPGRAGNPRRGVFF
jgi:hypothetical protein